MVFIQGLNEQGRVEILDWDKKLLHFPTRMGCKLELFAEMNPPPFPLHSSLLGVFHHRNGNQTRTIDKWKYV